MENFVCKITLSRLPVENRIRIQYTSLTDSTFEEEFDLSDLLLQTIERLNHWIKKDDSCDRQDLALIGRYLYNFLFPPDSQIRTRFEENYNFFIKNKRADSRLRIVLIFQENIGTRLSSYPWEFLYKSEGKLGFFLAGQRTELILTRFVPHQPAEIDVADPPLRILLAVAQPKEYQRMDTAEVISYLESLPDKFPGKIDLKIIKDPTYKQLLKLLDPHKPDNYLPHIFHFIGHGQKGQLALIRDAEEINELMIEQGRPNDTASWCDSTTLTQLFEKHQPRVVFLHAGNGAAAGSVDGFSALARDLVYAKIPAVIAMQYQISDRDASLFAMEFYQQVSNGAPVDEAVRASRGVLGHTMTGNDMAWNDRRFGTPVVYLQTEKAIILPGTPPSQPRSAVDDHRDAVQAAAQLTKIPCPNPNCTGLIRVGSKMCTKCFEILEPCKNPTCDAIILQKIGICDTCLFGLERNEKARPSAAPETAVRGGQQAGGAHSTIGDLQRGSTQTSGSTRIIDLRRGSSPTSASN